MPEMNAHDVTGTELREVKFGEWFNLIVLEMVNGDTSKRKWLTSNVSPSQ
jgi:hypothetical protein